MGGIVRPLCLERRLSAVYLFIIARYKQPQYLLHLRQFSRRKYTSEQSTRKARNLPKKFEPVSEQKCHLCCDTAKKNKIKEKEKKKKKKKKSHLTDNA